SPRLAANGRLNNTHKLINRNLGPAAEMNAAQLSTLLLLLLSAAALGQSKSLARAPEEVNKDFTSADDVAEYLHYLNKYFHSVSRPRFGKRGNAYDFRSPAEAAKYVTSLNQYLHSVSRPRFGKRQASFDTPAAAAEYINNLNQYLHSMSRPRFGKRMYRIDRR
ncbi:hypothetical protein BOX15_Mlig009822g2, partial [Macrostomum lignano]